MVYLLGGAPRAGKTTAAHRFVDRTGVSCFSIDYLKMGLVRGMPGLGIDVYDDPATAVKLWPILRGMIHTYVEERESILIEGYYLLPEYAAELHRDLGDRIRSCFLGYSEIPTMRKVREMQEHAPGGWSRGPGGWSREDDGEAAAMVEHLKSVSRRIRADCVRLGLQYFENAEDHDVTLNDVVAFLAGERCP